MTPTTKPSPETMEFLRTGVEELGPERNSQETLWHAIDLLVRDGVDPETSFTLLLKPGHLAGSALQHLDDSDPLEARTLFPQTYAASSARAILDERGLIAWEQ